MEKTKIIQLANYFEKPTPWTQAGINALTSLSSEDQQAVIEFILGYVFTEVKVGLGLIELPDNCDENDLSIFDKIADIYEEAAGDCYFCSENIDPNEDEFGPDTKLCLRCKLKLANFVTALGFPANKVFRGMPTRKAQKAKISIR